MKILLNGTNYALQERITLHELLQLLNSPPRHHAPAGPSYVNTKQPRDTNFAIAVNLAIVPRGHYHQFWLNENDKVEIVTAFQGG